MVVVLKKPGPLTCSPVLVVSLQFPLKCERNVVQLDDDTHTQVIMLASHPVCSLIACISNKSSDRVSLCCHDACPPAQDWCRCIVGKPSIKSLYRQHNLI